MSIAKTKAVARKVVSVLSSNQSKPKLIGSSRGQYDDDEDSDGDSINNEDGNEDSGNGDDEDAISNRTRPKNATARGETYYKPTRDEMDERIDFTVGLISRRIPPSMISRALQKKYDMGLRTSAEYLARAKARLLKRYRTPFDDMAAQVLGVYEDVIRDPDSGAMAKIMATNSIRDMLGIGHQYRTDEKESESVVETIEVLVSSQEQYLEFTEIKTKMSSNRSKSSSGAEAAELINEYSDEYVVPETYEAEFRKIEEPKQPAPEPVVATDSDVDWDEENSTEFDPFCID